MSRRVDYSMRFKVEANFGSRDEPNWQEVYYGQSRETAIRAANFWDERVDVRGNWDDRGPTSLSTWIDFKCDRAIEHILAGGFG